MKKKASIFTPYNALFLAIFIEYFPIFYPANQPSIPLGPIDLFATDVAAIFLAVYAFVRRPSGVSSVSAMGAIGGRKIQVIFGMFFAYGIIKWLIQGNLNTGSFRMMLDYTLAYLFLYFLPMHLRTQAAVKKLVTLLVIFLVYIFGLHIYAFASQGYVVHILGGHFLSMLSFLYFLSISRTDLLKLSPLASFLIKALIIAVYFMVGHRSGLIGILLGLIAYWFYRREGAIKEAGIILIIIFLGATVALGVSPKMLENFSDRAATTFDSSQDTYQGRFYNFITVFDLAKENPIIGKPLVTNESRQMKEMKVKKGSMTGTELQLVVTPHNLLLEWLLYYGIAGLLMGLYLLYVGFWFIKDFLRKNKNNAPCHKIGVVVLCTMTHNLFFAISNVTTSDIFGTFFLYFPVVLLIAISANKEEFCK